jgi:hypothetical protein
MLLLGAAGFFLVPTLLTDTEYAPSYSETAFESVLVGDTRRTVEARLGPPLARIESEPSEDWVYAAPGHQGFEEDGGIRGTFSLFSFGPDGTVVSTIGQTELSRSMSGFRGRWDGGYLGGSAESLAACKGLTRQEIETRYGAPPIRIVNAVTEWMVYSRSPKGSHYRLRQVGIDANGIVVEKKSYLYWD